MGREPLIRCAGFFSNTYLGLSYVPIGGFCVISPNRKSGKGDLVTGMMTAGRTLLDASVSTTLRPVILIPRNVQIYLPSHQPYQSQTVSPSYQITLVLSKCLVDLPDSPSVPHLPNLPKQPNSPRFPSHADKDQKSLQPFITLGSLESAIMTYLSSSYGSTLAPWTSMPKIAVIASCGSVTSTSAGEDYP